jgi:hypothetical protein
VLGSVKIALLWLAALVAGASPIYIRNYLLSGNPFFPLFPLLFPSPWMSHSWGAHFAQVQPSSPLHSLPSLWQRFPELMRETPWVVGAVLIFFTLMFPRALERRLLPRAFQRCLPLVIGSFLAYCLFVTTQGRDIELRYLGASLMILAAAGVGFFLSLTVLLPAWRAQKRAEVILLLALLAGSKVPTHLLWKVWRSPLGTKSLPAHTAGEAKAWIRNQAGNQLTVLVADNETYYLTPVPVTVLTEYPALDAVTYAEKDLRAFVEKVCAISHARFLLDSRPEMGGLAARFGAQALAPGRVFESQGAVVYDVPNLAQAMKPPVAPCL